MFSMLRAGLFASALIAAAPALAQSTAPAPEAAPPAATAPATETAAPAAPDGKALFRTKTCIACHGKDGAKAIQMYPDLAGQDAKYMLEQMNDIADGKRVSGPDARGYPRTQGMKDIMHLVNAEERAALAAYLASVPSPKPRPIDPAPDAARLADGKKAYTQNGCQTCHGADGLKPLATYPVIGGMKRDYLVLQLKEIRDGVRVNGKTKTMLAFAKKLDDAKIDLIADYLSQIERSPK